MAALERAVERRQIITCSDNGIMAGYLWHGPIHPFRDVTIFQACVDYDSQRRYLGSGMVQDLLALANIGNARGVKLNCASSNDSNQFWQAMGFYCTAVSQGGIRRARDINHWRTDIQAPLFTLGEVTPSTKPVDWSAYRKTKRMPLVVANKWARRYHNRNHNKSQQLQHHNT